MFENSLLILKSDYMQKRKAILLKLLQKGFQIQGQRKLLFSPEQAAEFYSHYAARKEFMLLVIMLCKGTSEAFILARENCIEELVNTMVCYFGNSEEMERNVHVSRTEPSVAHEISFIFPNYIHEPIAVFYESKFSNSDLVKDLMVQAHDITSAANCPPKHWKSQLAEWLTTSNSMLPRISNQCRGKAYRASEEKSTSVATTARATKTRKKAAEMPSHASSSTRLSISIPSMDSSMTMTSSSCITCSGFDGAESGYQKPKTDDSLEVLLTARTAKGDSSASVSVGQGHEEEHVCQEVVEEESHGSEHLSEVYRDDEGDLDQIDAIAAGDVDRAQTGAGVTTSQAADASEKEAAPTERPAKDATAQHVPAANT